MILNKLTEEDKGKVREAQVPEWTQPMLATLTKEYFSDPEWIYERKLDGVRCLVIIKGGSVRILSRNKNDLGKSYPEVTEALGKQANDDLIADGELVTFENDLTSFSMLQQRMHVRKSSNALVKKVPVYLYLFDLIHFGNQDISQLSLRRRKTLLKEAFSFDDPIRFCTHRNEDGKEYLQDACKKGWEGLIAKKASSVYTHGRSGNWLKFKCSNQQELVIGGYTDPQGERQGFGALLLGFYDNEKFRYAGKVGTGFTDKLLNDLYNKMKKLERKTSPFDSEIKNQKNMHWVRPELVAEIGFTEWTNDNKLRHPRYLGLRTDKKAKDVIKEA